MEVKVKHLKTNEWSGQTRYPNCYDAIGPYFTRTGRLYTGLTAEDEERLGDTLGYDLRSGSDFWDTFRVRIGSESITLRPEDDPMDELKYLFLKNHKRIAASLSDRKPTANYYLSVAEEEAKVANAYNKLKRKAYSAFDKMSAEEIKKCLRIYGIKADNVGDSVAEDRLINLIEQNPARFFEKWVDNKHRMSEYLLKDAVAKNVVKKNKNIYSYGTTTLGNTLEDAISFLDTPNNSDIKTAIINDTNTK